MPEEEEMEREQKPIQHIQGKQSQGEQTSKLSEWGQGRRAALRGLVGLLIAACAPTLLRPEPTPTAGPETLPTSTAVPPTAAAESPTATPPPEAPKPLPEVISSETLKEANRGIVVWNSEQTEKARAEAAAKGIVQVPLPSGIFEAGGRVQTTSRKDGLVVTDVDPTQEFEIPALISGKVIKAGKANANWNWIRIQGVDGNKLNILFPLGGTSLVNVGDQVSGERVILRVSYDQAFDNSFPAHVPKSALVAISLSDASDKILPFDQSNIQTDTSGRIVVVGPVGKGS